ncbi:endonuclease/exonuclease/phosphatase family protein [Herbidospora daliensis]|uniref:endonuclease/exonuclease/phosphatase family protein n=1 Tax=Herbidospora daliensis TaxID=295585 RepID=UPI000780FCB6|nr:endonuclease/exonuclease/phosphatase family protein [Herbidospora daliensis]
MDTQVGAEVGGEIRAPERSRGRKRRAVAWLLAGISVVWTVFRLTGTELTGFGTLLSTGTPYAVLGAVVAVMVAVLARARRAAALALASVVAMSFVVLPRALPSSQPPADGPSLRVLSINMRFGRADVGSLMALVRSSRPDVISVQELSPRAVEGLAAAGLGELMPYDHLEPHWSAAGSGVYSRFPLTPLAPFAPGDGHRMPYTKIEVPGGPPVELVDVHTVAPLGRDLGLWRDGLRSLPRPDPGTIRILAGDYNATFDHAEFRAVLGHGWVDAADATGKGLITTWPAGRRVPPLITIDHVLVDPRVAVGHASVYDVAGTDHRAVFTVLRLPSSAAG